MGNQAAHYLSYELDTEISIQKIDIDFFKDVYLHGVFARDLHGDTLIYSDLLKSRIGNWSIKNNFAQIELIQMSNAYVNLRKYKTDSVFNHQFIVDYFTTETEKSSRPFDLKLNTISLINSRFAYNNDHKPYSEYGVDFDHIRLDNLSVQVSSFYQEEQRFFANIDMLTFEERSGLKVDEFSSRVKFSDRKMNFDNLVLKNEQTSLDILQLSLTYHSFKNFQHFVDSVELNANIVNSKLLFKDLSYFVPQFKSVNQMLIINGDIKGTVNDLDLQNLVFGITKSSYLKGSGSLIKITRPDLTHFDFNLKELSINKNDIESIDLSGFGVAPIKLPEEVARLGQTLMVGNARGAYSDFYFKASVITQQGSAFAELNCKKPKGGLFSYEGWVDAANLNVGKILGDKTIGEITAHLDVKGRGVALKDLNMDVSGYATSATVMGYKYANIKFPKAHIENKIFEGLLVIQDKNIGLDFRGKIDFASKIPQFNFMADISKAHLYEINIPVKNKTTSFCGVIEINGFGNNLNEFNGYIKADEIAIYQDGKDYFFNKIELDAMKNPLYHQINIYSDFIDATLEGQFSIDSIGYSFVELASHIFPSLFRERETFFNTREKFDFDIKIKDLSVVTDFFIPRLSVASGTVLTGSFNSQKDDFNLTMNCGWLIFGNVRLDSINITTDKIVDLYALNFTAKDFLVNEIHILDNPSVLFSTYDENIDIGLSWYNSDSTSWGDLNMLGHFPDLGRFEFNFKDSQFYTIKNKWNIVSGSELYVDTTSLHLQNFTLYAKDQTVLLNGVVSENVEDILNVELANFDLRQFNPLLEPYGYTIKGRVEASGELSDVYNNVYFNADTYLSEFKVNEEYFGDVWSKVSWDRINKDFAADGALSLNGVKQIKFNGVYHVTQQDNNLDFNLNIKELNLKPYNVFLPDALSNLKGLVSGDVKLTGTPEMPDFNGKVSMKDVGAKVALLNTSYTLSGDIMINNDLVYMNYLPLRDANGRRARINGAFYHDYFKNYSYEFSIDMLEPFLCLNTTYDFNSLYYGTAYATGDVMVSYDKVRDLEIKVKAKTERGTNITLPLYGAKEVVLQDFVTFVQADSLKVEDEKMDLTGINMEFNLDVTKEASFEIVFDDLVGDKISGSGAGNILMEIDRFGSFNMYGQFEIERGDYLFTLQDVINKRFTVEKGGTISWYGDPYNADINLNALYSTRASLYDIMSEDVRERYRNKSEVEVVMNLSNSLFNPDLMFDIRVPRVDENAKAVVRSLIDTDEEKNKQVFSLLILNRFLPRMDMADNASGGLGLGQTITSELLSTQLSSWLSKLTGQTEVGLNYRSGDDISNSEMAVQVSRQFLDNNLSVSGNFGVAQGAGSAGYEKQSQVIGDVVIEYRLSEEIRLRAFNQSNQFDITRNDQAPFTQGIGVSYQKNFNRVREIIPEFMKRKKNKKPKSAATKPEELEE